MEFLNVNKIIFSANDDKVLSLNYENKEYKAIKLKRCFPFLSPNNYISVIDSDTNEEIGIINDLNELDETSRKIAIDELNLRYFLPVIIKVNKIKEKRNFATLDIKTLSGDKTITIQDIPFNINLYGNGKVIIKDVDGNLYEVSQDYLNLNDKNAKWIKNYI
jgi:hypothetical protein